jgi:PPK2 family polyphosphate:nucleotide phosphotransferase
MEYIWSMGETGVTSELVERIRCTGEAVDLRQRPTRVEAPYESKKQYKELLKAEQKQLSELQRQLYVGGAQGLLLVLQGLDAAGKDGIIRHVVRAFNPQGCRVYSFGPPNTEELSHDFLWRTTRLLPGRGQISVFNRSQYEEVLVVRVHPKWLEAQKVDERAVKDGSIWARRYEAILAQERHLLASGTRIVKLMLHVSAEEQAQRLLSRLEDRAKNWKFSDSDLEERGYREAYLDAYSACLSATASDEAPWYVVPADVKRTARLIVARILVETLESMDLSPPDVSPERVAELARIRERLEAD